MESFADLGVNSFFVDKLAKRGILNPTDIQRLVIPPLLSGRNVLFRSATGTGKTLAYLLPLFQAFLEPESIPVGTAMLICAPTYELCSQIKKEADFLLEAAPVKAALIIGSAPLSRQIEVLKKKPPVVVGNPARLVVLARMGKLNLGALERLVLDEGDRLVSDELFAETRELAGLAKSRQGRAGGRRGAFQAAACSATLAPRSRERLIPLLGGEVLTEETGDGEMYRTHIEHWAFFSEERRKLRTLCAFLRATAAEKALVFTGRGGQVGNILSQLRYHHISAAGLYGDMDKRARKAALDDFRAGRARVLVSSDLAARGLDIAGIAYVIALDVPPDGEGYIHRAGRTARAGGRGVMVTIGDAEELPRLAGIEKKLGLVVYPKILYKGTIQAP
jgi:superfamily II DNA/RNA helicase